ncbi:hypothetical protein HYX14_05745 [Candidatus Woesearchaeota archaeon]|nr:hypothetical protein [Candidatus Woesearchaeota archaeon]
MGFFIPHEQAAVVKYLVLSEPKGYMGKSPEDNYLNRAMSRAMGTSTPIRTERNVTTDLYTSATGITSDLYQISISPGALPGKYAASTGYDVGSGYRH